MQRAWSSGEGGLWFSFILRPNIACSEIPKLSLLTAAALSQALEKTLDLKTYIKWTNDILFDLKKIAGIIVETALDGEKLSWAAVGIGINVNNFLPDYLKETANSIKNIRGESVNTEIVLSSFTKEFSRAYLDFLENGFESSAKICNEKTAFLNEIVEIDGAISGINRGIDKDGALILETSSGIKKIVSGTLRLKEEH